MLAGSIVPCFGQACQAVDGYILGALQFFGSLPQPGNHIVGKTGDGAEFVMAGHRYKAAEITLGHIFKGFGLTVKGEL